MTKRPKIALVGRPNVGKSALFNCICQKRTAIVDEAEGVTRDRLYGEGELGGQTFTVIDTGGIDHRNKEVFYQGIREQTLQAIKEADALIMVVDGRLGTTELDLEVARYLQKTKKPLVLAVNKIDSKAQESLTSDFYSLGINPILGVSALHSYQILELCEQALEPLNTDSEEEEEEDTSIPKVALIGRPNVGKSTLLNSLLGENRSLVSPIPGTTRDAIKSDLIVDGKHYLFVDTAGLRRKNAEHEVVDKYAAIRTERALEEADICLFLMDAQEGFTTRDKKLASLVGKAGKPCLLIFNKWDLIKGFRIEHCMQSLQKEAPFFKHCPTLFISAKTGKRTEEIFPLVEEVLRECKKKIPTSELNQFFQNCFTKAPPPHILGKRLKLYYSTQTGTAPPRFVLFVNEPRCLPHFYKNYLTNCFRKSYSFTGTPIVLDIQGKKKKNK